MIKLKPLFTLIMLCHSFLLLSQNKTQLYCKNLLLINDVYDLPTTFNYKGAVIDSFFNYEYEQGQYKPEDWHQRTTKIIFSDQYRLSRIFRDVRMLDGYLLSGDSLLFSYRGNLLNELIVKDRDEIESIYKYRHNTQGQIFKITEFNNENELENTYQYFYANGLINKQIVYGSQERKEAVVKYLYNQNKNLINIQVDQLIYPQVIRFKRNEKGDIAEKSIRYEKHESQNEVKWYDYQAYTENKWTERIEYQEGPNGKFPMEFTKRSYLSLNELRTFSRQININ